MYKMIIVDDETWVHEGIKNTIDWNEYGVEVVGEAEDGEEALSLIEQVHPDIGIIDIRMPGMDGLELIRRIREKGESMEAIVLTGYGEFSYAQEAIALGVFQYILKPVEASDLIEAVKNCVNKIKTLKSENKPHFRDFLLYRAINNHSEAKTELKQYMDGHGITLHSPMLIGILSPSADCHGCQDELQKVASLSVTSYDTLVFPGNRNEVVFLFSSSENTDLKQKARDILHKAVSDAAAILKVSVSAGIGCTFDSIDKIDISYNQAVTAYSFRCITKYEGVYDIDEILDMRKNSIMHNTYEILINKIKQKDTRPIHKILTSFLFKCLSRDTWLELDSLRLSFIYLLNAVTDEVLGLSQWKTTPEQKRLDIIKSIGQQDTLEQIFTWTENYIIDLTESITPEYHNSRNRSIKAAVDFISENYSKDISLSDIADYVHLDPSYFSKIFSEEMKQPFSTYLASYRITMAKKLLESTTLKIYEIAQKVGYNDPRHFTKTFKKLIGLTPEQYRNSV
ncbi:MAG TPA: response regulator transcription factor [Clostridiaceae bacterium]|nr:response regulator transcription factor [Clostridiaceae bacterium]